MKINKHQNAPGKARVKRSRNKIVVVIVINILVLVIIGLLIGIWYVWQSGKNVVEVEPIVQVEKPKVVEAPKADPVGPVGVSTQVFTSPVQQGSNVSVTIRTRPEAACSIMVTYDKDKSNDAGLLPKTADEFGVVQWTWTVESSRPVGKWPVDITCGLGKESGYHKLELEVTPKS